MNNEKEKVDTVKPKDIPEYFIDRLKATFSVYGVNMTFGLSEPHPDLSDPKIPPKETELVRIRMSPQHAKVMVILLEKQLTQFEKELKMKIALPEGLLESLGLSIKKQ